MEILKKEVKRVESNPHTKEICVHYKVNQAFVDTLKDKSLMYKDICRRDGYGNIYYEDKSILEFNKFGIWYFEFKKAIR